jgi:hypothetical protein
MEKTMVAKFDGRCTTCNGRIFKGEWIVYNGKARHAFDKDCLSMSNPGPVTPVGIASKAAAPAVTANGAPIVAFLQAAKDRGLAFPNVTFAIAGGAAGGHSFVNIYIAGEKSRYQGALQVKVGGEWIGRIETTGNVAGRLASEPALLARLDEIAANPAAAAKEFAVLTGRCSFCARELTDEGSIEVGYGPICAKRFNLPHTAKGSRKVA